MDFTRNELVEGLENDQFELHYQPIISLEHLTVSGAEALIRWRHPDEGLLTPNYFLDGLKENHLLHQAGQWVLNECFEDWRTWIDGNVVDESFFLSMNVSFEELNTGNFVENLTETIQDSTVLPEVFYLELKEQTALSLKDKYSKLFERIEEISPIEFCVDNFGKHGASLERLKQLPVNTIKFDRNFLNPSSPENSQTDFAEYLIHYASDHGYTVIAEGIENRDLFEKYYSYGCQFGQGFYFSKPITGDPTGILDEGELKSIVSEIGGPSFPGRSEFIDAEILDLDVLLGVPESPIQDMLEHILIKNNLNYFSTEDSKQLTEQVEGTQSDLLLLDDKILTHKEIIQLIDKFLTNNQDRYVILLESENDTIPDGKLDSFSNLHLHQKPIGANDFVALLSAVSFRLKKDLEKEGDTDTITRYLGSGKIRIYALIFIISIFIGLSMGIILSSVSTSVSNLGKNVDSKIERLLNSIEKIEEYERRQSPDR